MTRPRSALVLVVSALALAGCGGGGGEGGPAETATPGGAAGYEEQVREADGRIAAAGERLAAGTSSEELGQIRSELEQTVRSVEQESPPYDLLPEHQRLTLAIWQAVDDAGLIADEGREQLGQGDLTPVVEALAEADAAIGEMEGKGYDVRGRA